ncbi:hypothetical protein IHE55_09575 [Streptomyces pactum]|uniref:PilZ domain-containing protein n=1 Tax=Streptomyces pactum TaxID=68249 RepID=A0ABS0NIV9_9ACTN|nr:hypothetical protein [Streptomyces pactum]MBH5335029.1 hypothetical protein [Streptomyces pactum]
MSSAIALPPAGPGAADHPTTTDRPERATDTEWSMPVDGLLIEDLSEGGLRMPPPRICICTVAAG